MIDWMEKIDDSFVPMAIGYLMANPWIVLAAYLLLKGLDQIASLTKRGKAKCQPNDSMKVPDEKVIEPDTGEFLLSGEEIAQHYD